VADVMPSQLANAVLSKFYDVLISGDESVPPSEDNFFSWCTPGIPVEPGDFDFLTQGFTGVVKKEQADILTGPVAEGTTPEPLPPAELERLRAQDTARLYMQAEAFARLVDFVPDVSKLNNEQFARLAVLNNEGTLSEIYARVLRMSQVVHTELDDATKANVARLQGLLVKKITETDVITQQPIEREVESDLVTAYKAMQFLYEDAVLQYNARRIDAMTGADAKAVNFFAMNANVLRNRVNTAKADWMTRGHRGEYEKIAAYISQVMERDLTVLKQEYKDAFERARLTGIASGSDFQYTTLVPGNFAKSNGWTAFSFSSSDFQSRSASSYQNKKWNVSGGASYLGIFGGRASHSESSSHQEYTGTVSTDQFALSFEICQVPIVRPWFMASFLSSKTWRFDVNSPDVAGDLLSNGKSPPDGLMPGYPTSIIFVRNLKMSLGHSESLLNYVKDQQSSSTGAGGYVSFGPFFLGGSGGNMSSGGQSTRDYGYHVDEQGISSPGMSIAGFKVHTLDERAPDPLSTVTAWV
jgi:hypothetical protein